MDLLFRPKKSSGNNITFDLNSKKFGMIRTLVLFCSAIFITGLNAQSLDDLEFGTDTSLEVVTWNIEWFPKDGSNTVDYVTDILYAIDADIYALQEIDDTTAFRQMVENMNGFEWFIPDGYFAGLAYVYKPSVISLTEIYRIYETEPYWRPFPRSPLILRCSVADQEYFVINNHFKCCGDGYLDMSDDWDEEKRRYDASTLLKEHIDEELDEKNVILTGDLNDILTDSEGNNVFQMFIDDSEHFLCADMAIAEGSQDNWSYPTWPSHLDHIIITDELFDEYESQYSALETILVDEYLDNGWWEYENYVSDHRPVGFRFEADINTDVNELESFQQKELSIFPNPVKEIVNVRLPKGVKECKTQILDARGEILYQSLSSGRSMKISVRSIEPGLYILRATCDEGNSYHQKLIVKH